MKTSIFRLIFLAALTALFAVACTNETEQPKGQGGEVARISAEAGGLFNSGSGDLKSSTRATNDVWEGGDAIGVTMVKPQTLEVINPYRNLGYNTSGDGKFSPNDASQIIYFPTSDEEVTFKAYYPYKKDLAPNLVIPVSVKDQTDLAAIDLMTAEHISGTSTKDPNVKLHFYHRLAKVVVNLTTDNESISILNSAKVTIKGLKTEAVYNLIEEKLVVDNNLPDAGVSMSVVNAKAEGIILPRAAGEGVEFVITTANGGEYTAVLRSDFEFEAGYVHTFNLRLKSPAEISATIEPWLEGPTHNFDVVRLVTGLGVTEGFDVGDKLDLFLKEGNNAEFGFLQNFTYEGNNKWTTASPVYWEAITGSPAIFRGAGILDEALHSSQMDDIIISDDIEVSPYTGVNLKLKHAGTKVTVKLMSSDGAYSVEDLKSAKVILPQYLNEGSLNEATGAYVVGTGRGDIIPVEERATERTAIFPAQTIASGTTLVKVEIDGSVYELKKNENAFIFEQGKHHEITIDIHTSEVLLTTKLIDWIPGETYGSVVTIGQANLGANSGDLINGDQLYLYTDGNPVPGHFTYSGTAWNYSAATPLYWENIANSGKIYASITRSEINPTSGYNQSKDYITAEPVQNDGGKSNTAIHFEMHHRVAKVNVKLTSSAYTKEQLQAAKVTFPGYKIGGTVVNGIYNTEGSSIGTITVGPLNSAAEASAYLQPQTLEEGSTVALIEIASRQYTAIFDKNVEYKAGYATNLTINIEPSELKLSVKVSDWGKIEHNLALSFETDDASASGFLNNDLIKFYNLGSGNSVTDKTVYKYTGNVESGTLVAEGTPWFRDDFRTGDKISAVFPSSVSDLTSGNTFDWTSKSSGTTNDRLDDILVAAPDATNGVVIDDKANVSLHFKHVLSKVTVNIFRGDGFTPEEFNPLPAVTLLGFQLSGTINVVNATATANGTATASFAPTKLSDPNEVEGMGTALGSYEAFIMPQVIGTVGSKTAIIGVKLGNQTYFAEIERYDFKAGENHVFNITLKKTGLIFSATVAPWQNGTGGSIVIE